MAVSIQRLDFFTSSSPSLSLWSLITADAADKLNGFNQNTSKQASGNSTARRFPMSEQFNTSAWNSGSVDDVPDDVHVVMKLLLSVVSDKMRTSWADAAVLH